MERGIPLTSILGKEIFLNFRSNPCRTQGFGIDAAPARLYLGQHFLAALDDRVVKGTGTLHLFQNNGGDDIIVEKRRLAVGNFVLQRDPQIFPRGFGRGKLGSLRQNTVLHPVQVAGIIDVPHEINVSGQNTDTVQMGESVRHVTLDLAVFAPF